MFMGLTGSNSGLFRAPGFIVSPVGKGEKIEVGKEGKRNRKRKEGREEGRKKGRKEGRGNKKRSEETKEDGILTKIKINK